jgi:hypothetical protein
METNFERCMDINEVSSFCNCIADAQYADPAAQNFCARAKTGTDPYTSGDDLVELKKALKDMEG